jgi:hypothetical protein
MTEGWIPACAGMTYEKAGMTKIGNMRLLRNYVPRKDSDELYRKNFVEIINNKCIIIIVK